ARRDLLVGGILLLPAGVADGGLEDARQVLEGRLHAPEAAAGEGCLGPFCGVLRAGGGGDERSEREQEGEDEPAAGCRHHRRLGCRSWRAGYFAPSMARSASIASDTCLVAWNCELNTCRTTPCRSMTKVTRPGSRPSVAGTPYCFRTVPPRSASRTKGSLYLVANFSCAASPSELTPMTSAPASFRSSYWSRKAQASLVQPGVSSFG